jgi:2-desacetyl-2-hydroxyethyl bacteriochlorophyllide A dehydrogenase
MLAAVFEGNGKLALKKMPVPKIGKPDEVLLKVEAASICGTDVHILHVPPGHPATVGAILGHEYVGEVLEVGPACEGLKPGDKVAVDPNVTCGICPACQLGRHNMCANMTTLGIFIHGGFAPFNVAPARQLHKYDRRLKPEIAVFAEPLACVVNAFKKLNLFPGENVVVLGAGPIGQYFIQLSKAAGAGKVVAVEPNQRRRKFAKISGANVVIDPTKQNLLQSVEKLFPSGPEAVIDAVGSLMETAVAIAGRGGRIMLFGQNANARAAIAQNLITRNELTVLGSYIARHTFPEAVRLLETGKLNVKPLITHRLKLKDIKKGIAAMEKGQAIKAIVFP